MWLAQTLGLSPTSLLLQDLIFGSSHGLLRTFRGNRHQQFHVALDSTGGTHSFQSLVCSLLYMYL